MNFIDEAFFSTFAKDIYELDSSNSSLAYYCDLSVVHSLINNKEFWLTSVCAMNDTAEIRYSIELIREYLSQPKNKFCDVLDSICLPDDNMGWKQFLEQKYLQSTYLGQYFHSYIMCLTEHNTHNHDTYGKLSMWRGYGRGHGGAIVFDKDIINSMDGTIYVTKVHYYTKEQFFDVLDDISDNIAKFGNKLNKLDRAEFVECVQRMINSAVISIKHPSFEEENEWRLVFNDLDINLTKNIEQKVEIIGGNPRIVCKYKVEDILFKYLKKILIGPNPYFVSASTAIRHDLFTNGITNEMIEIGYCGIPLRP